MHRICGSGGDGGCCDGIGGGPFRDALESRRPLWQRVPRHCFVRWWHLVPAAADSFILPDIIGRWLYRLALMQKDVANAHGSGASSEADGAVASHSQGNHREEDDGNKTRLDRHHHATHLNVYGLCIDERAFKSSSVWWTWARTALSEASEALAASGVAAWAREAAREAADAVTAELAAEARAAEAGALLENLGPNRGTNATGRRRRMTMTD